jgi:hydrogenase/urease accessory protein HupE
MRRLALLCAFLAVAAPASAHPVPFSYLDVRLDATTATTGQPSIAGALTVHIFDAAHELSIDPPERLLDADVSVARTAALQALVRQRLAFTGDGISLAIAWGPLEVLRDKQSLRLPFTAGAARPPAALVISAALFPYDERHQTFVNVYDGGALRQQAILGGGRTTLEYFSGSPRGTLAVARRFVATGIHHILIGPDHLLFLVGLLLLGGSIRRLALVVTAFTLAHSVTLSIAALNMFSPAPRVVEPLIALSIVYVGIDNLMVRGGRDARVWIAFAFGLVHGFGFAGVLREMDLPARALGWSLFSFNAGVEVGQLMVVVPVASALAVLRHHSEAAGHRFAVAGSLVVVVAGAFWFVQRLFFAGGSL